MYHSLCKHAYTYNMHATSNSGNKGATLFLNKGKAKKNIIFSMSYIHIIQQEFVKKSKSKPSHIYRPPFTSAIHVPSPTNYTYWCVSVPTQSLNDGEGKSASNLESGPSNAVTSVKCNPIFSLVVSGEGGIPTNFNLKEWWWWWWLLATRTFMYVRSRTTSFVCSQCTHHPLYLF